MMAIVARCDSCGMQFQAEPHLVGKTVPCPSCGGQLAVPTGRQLSSVNAARQQPAPAAMRSPAAAHKPAVRASTAGVAQIVSCSCGTRFKANAQLAGKTVACPACQQPLQIPMSPLAARPALPPKPADDFWDALPPAHETQKVAVAATPTPAEESITGHQATALAISLLSRGLSPHQVRSQLIERGVSRGETERVVDALVPESKSKPRTSGVGGGATNMLVGAIVCFIGLAVTIGSYVAAEPGGVFLLAYGPIIFGGIQFVRGCIQLAG
jgi:hypothetical protein